MGRRTGTIVAALLVAGALPASARAACPNEDLRPSADNLAAVSTAMFCLHNEARASAGLPALRWSTLLATSAAGHSADMVARSYFDHDDLDGRSPFDRIEAAGYIRAGSGWTAGENIAWGSGPLATPRSIMDGWMESPGHRANILRRGYRDLGLGVVAGAPRSGSTLSGAATYTANFGTRDVPDDSSVHVAPPGGGQPSSPSPVEDQPTPESQGTEPQSAAQLHAAAQLQAAKQRRAASRRRAATLKRQRLRNCLKRTKRLRAASSRRRARVRCTRRFR